jgi:hypothetical protein
MMVHQHQAQVTGLLDKDGGSSIQQLESQIELHKYVDCILFVIILEKNIVECKSQISQYGNKPTSSSSYFQQYDRLY